MPFIRISLRKGRTPEQLKQLTDTVHEVLVRSFNVPQDDRFQVVHQHGAEEFFYDPGYFGVQRTDDLVYIQVFAGKPRTTEVKRAFFKDLSQTLATSCGLSPDNVFVVISTSGAEDWSFGRGLAQMLGDR